MRVKITAGGIYGADGEIPIGTEITVENEPLGWAGRYEVISGDEDGKTAVINPEGGGLDLESMTVAELKALAAEHTVELGDATKKADIIAAIQLAAEEA